MHKIIYSVIGILIVLLVLWNLFGNKETMCNIERPICDHACQKAKYEVCLVKGGMNC